MITIIESTISFDRLKSIRWGIMIDDHLLDHSIMDEYSKSLHNIYDLKKANKLKSLKEVLESGTGTCLEVALSLGEIFNGDGKLYKICNYHALWIHKGTIFSMGCTGISISPLLKDSFIDTRITEMPYSKHLYKHRLDFFKQ